MRKTQGHKNNLKKIDGNEVIVFPSIQEKICNKMIELLRKIPNSLQIIEMTEREISILHDECVEREINKQKIILLSELLTSDK